MGFDVFNNCVSLVDGMIDYAKKLLNGDGIEINKDEALKYYKLAAGNEESKLRYDEIIQNSGSSNAAAENN